MHLAEDGDIASQHTLNTLHTQNQQFEENWLPPVDLTHLNEEERKIAEQVLREEADVFCRHEDDHGDVPDMEMEINLTDNIPVAEPHRRIPRPLYEEVKNFINDLVVNKWVQESNL